jgi:hypothetical protein
MTITSIGYGDIVPANTTEYIVCVVLMLFGGATWAYIIGNSCGILANLEMHTIEFQRDMDELNYTMKQRNIKPELRRSVREYFHFQKELPRERALTGLINKMSPKVGGEFTTACNSFLAHSNAYFLSQVPPDCQASITRQIEVEAYAPREEIGEIFTMYIMRKGIVAKGGQILDAGCIWGEDMILDTVKLMKLSIAQSLTFVQVFKLTRTVLDDITAHFPAAAMSVRKAQIRMAFRRAVFFVAKTKKSIRTHRTQEAEMVLSQSKDEESPAPRRMSAAMAIGIMQNKDDGKTDAFKDDDLNYILEELKSESPLVLPEQHCHGTSLATGEEETAVIPEQQLDSFAVHRRHALLDQQQYRRRMQHHEIMPTPPLPVLIKPNDETEANANISHRLDDAVGRIATLETRIAREFEKQALAQEELASMMRQLLSQGGAASTTDV